MTLFRTVRIASPRVSQPNDLLRRLLRVFRLAVLRQIVIRFMR